MKNHSIYCKFQHWDCYVWLSCYSLHPETPAIVLRSMKDMSAVVKATVWVEGLKPGEVAIKEFEEGKGVTQVLLDAKVIGPQLRTLPCGFETVGVHTLIPRRAEFSN